MERCAMYPLFKLAGILRTWQIRYCTSDYHACERYRRVLAGRPVPVEMMPNGTLLKQPGNKLRVVK